MRLKASGTVSVETNPMFIAAGGNPADLPYSGSSYGPDGINGSLRMSIRAVDGNGTQQEAWTVLGEDSTNAWIKVQRMDQREFEVSRTGINGSYHCMASDYSCPGPSNDYFADGHDLTSSQTLELETFDPLEWDFPSGQVPVGDSVTATVAAHPYIDTIYDFNWSYHQGDTLPEAAGFAGSSWLWSQGCRTDDTSCTFTPLGSGRLYLKLKVKAGSTNFETVHSDVIWSDSIGEVLTIRLTPVDGDWAVYPDRVFEDHDRLIEVAVLGRVAVQSTGTQWS